ncbi:MAG: hypothetical protein WBQ25_11035 [Nitrososphaeraceae archaeon]
MRSGKKPFDDSSHSDLYYKGFETVWKYATEHVKVIVEHGHVVSRRMMQASNGCPSAINPGQK